MHSHSADQTGTKLYCVPDMSPPLKDRVDKKILDAYVKSVEGDAKAVCDGIVAAMLTQKLKASASQHKGMWMVTVADKPASAANDDHPEEHASLAAAPTVDWHFFSNIRINSRHIPQTISALRAFFKTPRAVAGLNLTVATIGVTATGYQLAVKRASKPSRMSS